MSTTIKQNNTNLQAVLDSVNALEPNSGATVDTCTVEITAYDAKVNTVVYSAIDTSGQIETKQESINNSIALLSNIICGSVIHCTTNIYSYTNLYSLEDETMTFLFGAESDSMGYFAFTAPTSANVTGKIYLSPAGASD